MSKPPPMEPVMAYTANCRLRAELGEDFKLADVVTEDRIDACDKLLKKAAADFFADAAVDLAAIEQMVTKNKFTGDLDRLLTHTYNIKSLAKVLGFLLITEVCVHIVQAIHSEKLNDKKRRALLAQLIGTLRLTFENRVESDGGDFGKKLRAQLGAL